MSERARDRQQAWDDVSDEEIIAFAEASETIRYLPDGRFLYKPRTTTEPWKRRTSPASFLWACAYVLATHPFVRGFAQAMAVGAALAVAFALVYLYFWIANYAL